MRRHSGPDQLCDFPDQSQPVCQTLRAVGSRTFPLPRREIFRAGILTAKADAASSLQFRSLGQTRWQEGKMP